MELTRYMEKGDELKGRLYILYLAPYLGDLRLCQVQLEQTADFELHKGWKEGNKLRPEILERAQ